MKTLYLQTCIGSSIPHKNEYICLQCTYDILHNRPHSRTQNMCPENHVEVILSIFLDHNAKKVEISHKESAEKLNTWKLKNILLNSKPVKENIKEEIKIPGNK